jgi:hypothetical protein
MIALESFLAALPDDTISPLPLSARFALLSELISIDRAAGIEPENGLLADIEALPPELRIAGVLALAVERYRQARRAA